MRGIPYQVCSERKRGKEKAPKKKQQGKKAKE